MLHSVILELPGQSPLLTVMEQVGEQAGEQGLSPLSAPVEDSHLGIGHRRLLCHKAPVEVILLARGSLVIMKGFHTCPVGTVSSAWK